ncbi:MAG: flagellar hook-length control protein FliK [Planctomycetota bacterium]|nr:flagellar hook-length control protein FliK [Planctomycetota bacterium]
MFDLNQGTNPVDDARVLGSTGDPTGRPTPTPIDFTKDRPLPVIDHLPGTTGGEVVRPGIGGGSDGMTEGGRPVASSPTDPSASVRTTSFPVANSAIDSANGSVRDEAVIMPSRVARDVITSTMQASTNDSAEASVGDAQRAAPARGSSGVRDEGSSDSGSRRERSGSLAQLLKAHSLEAESAPAPSVEPAMSRVREVQQQLAFEHAASNASPRVPANASGPQLVPANGLTMGALEGRNSVLSDVLARTGAETKLAEQTTQITARGLSALASQRGGALTLRLNPTSLGEVAIRMSVVEGVVRADLVASSAAARAMLEGGLDVLRGSMESRGLTVERLVVQAASAAGDSSGVRSEGQNQGQSNQGGAREQAGGDGRQDAAGHESRGRGDERRDRSGVHDPRYPEHGASFEHLMGEEST